MNENEEYCKFVYVWENTSMMESRSRLRDDDYINYMNLWNGTNINLR